MLTSFFPFLQKKQLVLDESTSFNPVTMTVSLCTDVYIAKEQWTEYKALLVCVMCSFFFLFVCTKWCVNIPDRYLGDACFESQPSHWLFWRRSFMIFLIHSKHTVKRMVMQPLYKPLTDPESSRSLRLWDFETFGTCSGKVSPTHWQPLRPWKYSRYSFLLEAESIPGP